MSEEDFPYWKDISQTMDSPSPTPFSMSLRSTNFSESPDSSLSELEIHPSIANFFYQLDQEQEEDIPFDPPIISKFGPISRLKTKDTVPLKVMADEVSHGNFMLKIKTIWTPRILVMADEVSHGNFMLKIKTFWTPRIFAIIIRKFEQCSFTI